MADIYVSVDGSDENSGNSTSAPLRGIQTGIDKLKAGDTLHIMNGTYYPDDEGLKQWVVDSKHGTSALEITIQAYTGHTPALSGGASGHSNGQPKIALQSGGRVGYTSATYQVSRAALVEVSDCSYLTFDGLIIQDSLGHALQMKGTNQNLFADEYVGSASEGDEPAFLHHITVQNCIMSNTRQRTMLVENAWDVTCTGNEMFFASWAWNGGSGGPLIRNTHYFTFDSNYMHHLCGEAFVVRTNESGPEYKCQRVYITNNIWWDNEDGIYITASKYIICAGNFLYCTPQEQNEPRGIEDNGGMEGIVVRTAESDRANQGIDYVLVAHNVVVEATQGIRVRVDKAGHGPGYEPQPMNYIYITNNTVVNCRKWNIYMGNRTAKNCVMKNNISINSKATRHVYHHNATNAQLAGWDADYNLYGGSDPESEMLMNMKGSNDQYDVLPGLLDDDAPTKGQVYELSNQAGYRVNFAHKTGFDDANGFRIPSGSAAESAGATLTAPAGWNSDSYGDDMSDWIDVEYDFSQEGTNDTRTGDVDIGAHQYGEDGGSTAPVISAITVETAASYDAVVYEEIDFATTASGGTGALSYLWDFGDGNTTDTQDPSHTYEKLGYFIVRLTVTDSKGLSDTDTVIVNVSRDITSPDTTVKVEQVLVSAGAASYTVSSTPKAIFMMMTGATTDDTLVDGTLLSAGVWSNDGEQLAASIYAKHSATTSATRSTNIDDGVLHFLQESVSWSDVATVDSVTSTAVSMSWPAVNNGEKVLTWNFYGDDVTNPTAQSVALGSENSTVKITGDYNRLIMPSSLGASSSSTRRGVFSLGVSARDGNTVCHTYQNKNNRGTTDIVSLTATDRVAYRPSNSIYVIIDAWDSSGITFKVIGGDVNEFVPALLMNVSGSDWDIGIFETPTATGNNDYDAAADVQEGALGIDGDVLWTFGSLATSYDSGDIVNDSAGVLNFHAVDDTNDYTLAISSDDDNTVSDESSYYSSAWNPRDYDGSSEAEGAISIITNGFRIAPTTAAATAYTNAYVLFEETSTVSSIVADLDYYLSGSNPADDEPIYAGDTVQMQDLSAPSTGNSIDTWTWEWDDGTANGTTVDPTHAWTQAGTYTITLTVDDDASAGPVSNTKDITILTPGPTMGFDIDTDIVPTSGTGLAPLACEVDGSGIVAGSGETIDFVRWIVLNDAGTYYEEYKRQPDGTLEFTLSDVGSYHLYYEVFYTNELLPVNWIIHRDAWVVTETDPTVVTISSDYGAGRCPTGPFDITFSAVVNGEELTDASKFESIAWTFGDATGSSAWQPTNTYAAVSSATAYTVAVTVTAYETGTTYAASETAYITLYPVPTAPPTLADLIERITNVLAVDYLDGAWTQGGAPNTSTYYQSNAMPWADANVRIIEDGVELTAQVSAAAVQANPGSYLIVFGGTTLTARIHPTNSDDPNTNGSTYRWLYN